MRKSRAWSGGFVLATMVALAACGSGSNPSGSGAAGGSGGGGSSGSGAATTTTTATSSSVSSASTTSSTSTSTSTSASASTTSSTGTGGAGVDCNADPVTVQECIACNPVPNPSDPNSILDCDYCCQTAGSDGAFALIVTAIDDCACKDPNGPCVADCSANFCTNMQLDQDCINCAIDQVNAQTACGVQAIMDCTDPNASLSCKPLFDCWAGCP
jgi:hypothetical protein